MRLPRFDPGSVSVGSGGGIGRGGSIGCGTLVIVVIAALVFGVDPGQMLGTVSQVQEQSAPQQAPGSQSAEEICTQNDYALESCNALSSLNKTWEPLFREAGIEFRQPTLHFYRGGTRSGCGAAQSAMGPFYCPADYGIYIDTTFYDQMAQRMGAGGDFARYYVIAHEYGHHIQNLTGVASQVRSAQVQDRSRANNLSVRMELMADCYAGVWAGRNRSLIEPGDVREGLQAASAIGDDNLMRGAGRRANPESFTHGSSAQRMEWLNRGISTGDEDQCDTFADMRR